MVTRITRRSLSKLIVLPIAFLVFPALAQNVTPNMTEVPRLAIGGYDTPRLAQMNDKAEWRCMYAGLSWTPKMRQLAKVEPCP